MVQTKITLIAILTITFFLGIPCEEFGVSSTSPWWTHFTYHFFHGNLIHLLSNVYAIWFCVDKKRFTIKTLLSAYLLSVVASFIVRSSIPIVGLSGMIFVILGINLSSVPTKINITYMLAILIIGYIIPNISGSTHLICFLVGLITSAMYKNIKSFKHDYR